MQSMYRCRCAVCQRPGGAPTVPQAPTLALKQAQPLAPPEVPPEATRQVSQLMPGGRAHGRFRAHRGGWHGARARH